MVLYFKFYPTAKMECIVNGRLCGTGSISHRGRLRVPKLKEFYRQYDHIDVTYGCGHRNSTVKVATDQA